MRPARRRPEPEGRGPTSVEFESNRFRSSPARAAVSPMDFLLFVGCGWRRVRRLSRRIQAPDSSIHPAAGGERRDECTIVLTAIGAAMDLLHDLPWPVTAAAVARSRWRRGRENAASRGARRNCRIRARPPAQAVTPSPAPTARRLTGPASVPAVATAGKLSTVFWFIADHCAPVSRHSTCASFLVETPPR